MKTYIPVGIFSVFALLFACRLPSEIIFTQTATAVPTSTMTPLPPTPTITPTPTPEDIADSQDLPVWVDEFVRAHSGKVTVNDMEMDANQLTNEIRKDSENFAQEKQINGNEYVFVVVNGVPLAIRDEKGYWQETTMKTMGDLTSLKIGTLIDGNKKPVDWWGMEYHFGTATIGRKSIPNRNEIDFGAVIYQTQIANDNNMQVRLHAVLFPGDKPLWMEDGFTQNDLDNIVQKMVEDAKQQHMTEIVVVNESGAPPYDERKDIYWKKFGMEYIIRAFQMAREIYPEAKLIYNDGKNHLKGSDTTKSTLLVSKKLHQEGLIDYVGVEMHIDQDRLPNKQDLIDVFISYPVPVVITEYDALLTYLPEDQRDAKLSEITKTVFDGCLESRVCIGVTTWGANDSVGWQGRSLLRDVDNKRKQAYYVAMQSMFEHLP